MLKWITVAKMKWSLWLFKQTSISDRGKSHYLGKIDARLTLFQTLLGDSMVSIIRKKEDWLNQELFSDGFGGLQHLVTST